MVFFEIFQHFPVVVAIIFTVFGITLGYAAYCLNVLHHQYDHIPGPERSRCLKIVFASLSKIVFHTKHLHLPKITTKLAAEL
jgi:hypothetical protein